MSRPVRFFACLAVIVSCIVIANAKAQEDEREWVEKMERAEVEMVELAELREALLVRAKEMIERGDREATGEIELKIRETEERLHRLEAHMNEMREARQHRHQRQDGVRGEIHHMMQQLEHMHAAHNHLKEAGLEDLAHVIAEHMQEVEVGIKQAQERAHRTMEEQRRREEERIHEEERRHEEARRREIERRQREERGEGERSQREEMRAVLEEFGGAIRELRQEVQQLREEVEELRGNRQRSRQRSRDRSDDDGTIR